MTVEFVQDKETKNTIRFTATGDVAGSIYIRKGTDLANAKSIFVNVSVKKEG